MIFIQLTQFQNLRNYIFIDCIIGIISPALDNSINSDEGVNPWRCSIKNSSLCIVGLTTEPKRLYDIRKNRMNSLKETENKYYTDIENIKKETKMNVQTFNPNSKVLEAISSINTFNHK